MKDVCVDRLTLKEYNALGPYEQGYVSYIQSYWPESEIPRKCHYARGSPERERWREGAQTAVIHMIDIED